MSFQLNDPVHVQRDGGSQLEGVVAFLGTVKFADGDDWVGVRLTGSSVGLGRNDGTVQGQKYFDCPTQCGIFVKISAIKRRELTRLEELRLRRELATGGSDGAATGGSSSSGGGSRTPGAAVRTPARPTTAVSSSRTPGSAVTTRGAGGALTPPPSASSARTATTTPATTSRSTGAATSRLEEIRQRRAQLQKGTTTGTASTSSTPAAKTPASSSVLTTTVSPPKASSSSSTSDGSAALQKEVEDLQSQLSSQSDRIKSLQDDLDKSQSESSDKDRQIKALQKDLKQSKADANKSSSSSSTTPSSEEQQKRQIEDLQHQIEELGEKMVKDTKKARETTDEIQTKFQQAEVDLAASKALVENLQNELSQRDAASQQLEQRATADASHYKERAKLQAEVARDPNEVPAAEVDLAASKALVENLQNELSQRDAASQQLEQRATADASHYKERAKLQAEVASLNRRVEQLELDKQELEHNVEELALDKEQLEEGKEQLEDRLEELKLDSETAQMEAEEAKAELEETRNRLETLERLAAAATSTSGSGDPGIASTNNEDDQEAQDLAQNLSIQNARLREALIRLREQSSVEKMDMTRQLRSVEKEANEAKAVSAEVESLREARKQLEEEVADLKDMVEQGSAYEVMVEDLSDRVLSLEEELMTLQQTIREMEEAADITAEMEEVQADELKALNREMEDRETVIRNLEEAIKMQRKREDDFQRTVSNYRNMVEKLNSEKNALLELQQGGEGEKSDLVSASQKALARAAQLVQDAAEMRKREAQAAIDRIESQVRLHLSERLESMLPPSVAQSEISSIKGELLLSKVVGKASLSLDGIARSFNKTCRARAWEWRTDSAPSSDGEESLQATPSLVVLSDDQQQLASTMIHQSEVAHVAIDVSGDLLWLLSAGQWPDLLSAESSAELGAILGHSMGDLDFVLGNVLNTLKEEGVLSPHQSNIGQFRQAVVTTMQTLRSHIEQDGVSLVPLGWKPPALKLFRDASRAKYSSLGCYAAVASVITAGDMSKAGDENQSTKELVTLLKGLLRKLDQASSEGTKSCLRLAHLDVLDETIVAGLSEAAESWRSASDDLLGNIYNMLLSDGGVSADTVAACEAATDEVVKFVSHFASVLRSANLTDAQDQSFHPFSPEVADVWEGVTILARAIRSKDGDPEDINFLSRARTIEHHLEVADEAVPALTMANSKVASLEKALSLRSKEISVQNARLSELEKLLAKTSAQPSSRLVSSQMVPSEELNAMKEENRVLAEAMDVLHRQVEEYENEIRFLNSKSPAKSRSRAPRRTFATDSSALRDHSRSSESLHGLQEEPMSGAFEAALFRPALLAVRQEAAIYKNKAMVDTILNLPPLNVSLSATVAGTDEEKSSDEEMGVMDNNPFLDLSTALSNYQRETSSMHLVDLMKPSPRTQLHNTLMRKAAASAGLDQATASARQWLESKGMGSRSAPVALQGDENLLGSVRFMSGETTQTPRVIPV
eukprot:CAMPEP_0113524720 /NCGR_PEP_ID=MMETSP0014_2-20120614/46362_1 /TAXON_ID=2857 /ORGANISM="Nitzschia sp." /LENGTH=1482 /DNA_ID=CAMNT_0000422841 /DNA_START=80 /DNA_END=4525 /DNA_ORIENTATION=+ /assembly_acc=CAM_ASM_000159